MIDSPKSGGRPPPPDTVRGWSPAPRAQALLLPPGTLCPDGNGGEVPAIGTGIIPVVGSARSAKTTGLALPLCEWAALADPDRSIAFLGAPDPFMEALPAHLRDRSVSTPIEDLATLRDAVVLLDDAGLVLSSRDSMRGVNRLIGRVSGVLSHLGLTVILVVQSMAAVDVALMRSVELAPLVKRVDPMALEHERSTWGPPVREAQRALAGVGFDRSYYYSLADDMLCRAPWPDWCRPDPDHPERADALSRPYRYLPQADLDRFVSGVAGRPPAGPRDPREDE